jgi:hypothetical protein
MELAVSASTPGASPQKNEPPLAPIYFLPRIFAKVAAARKKVMLQGDGFRSFLSVLLNYIAAQAWGR